MGNRTHPDVFFKVVNRTSHKIHFDFNNSVLEIPTGKKYLITDFANIVMKAQHLGCTIKALGLLTVEDVAKYVKQGNLVISQAKDIHSDSEEFEVIEETEEEKKKSETRFDPDHSKVIKIKFTEVD